MDELPPTEDEKLESVKRLTRDLRSTASMLSKQEARFLVDAYYMLQDNRIRCGAQASALAEGKEPNLLMDWLFEQSSVLEKQIQGTLGVFSKANPVGAWSQSIIGIGPVLSAGLLAHIDIERAPTVGHIWSFAGLEPNAKWEKGKRRPWNADLKKLCWKIGESFVKQQNNDNDIYGHLLIKRKKEEWERNLNGRYGEIAAGLLASKNFSKTTTAYKFYSGAVNPVVVKEKLASGKNLPQVWPTVGKEEEKGLPMLPPAHIHARARRWTVKLFLAHWHEVAYRETYGKAPPNPYPIAFLGHAHKIEPSPMPN